MNKRRKGFMLLDVLAGLMILAVMATILIVAISGRSRAVQRISNHRTSIEAARETILKLQTGEKLSEDPTISINKTGNRVGDLEWVEVKVKRDGRETSLVGLARANGGAK